MSNNGGSGAVTRVFSLSLDTMGFITWLVFLVLKLTGISTMSWFWVWFPLWAPLALSAVVFIVAFIVVLIIQSKQN